MVLKKFTYTDGKRNKTEKVKMQNIFSLGLLFRKSSPSLLWDLGREKRFSIFSLFCYPFEAIWLDENREVIKKIVVDKWRFRISGRGRYLLEIPLSRRGLPKKDKTPTRTNRNI